MDEQYPAEDSQLVPLNSPEGKNSNSKQPKEYEYDDILRLAGGFGRYPMLLYAFTCVVSIPTGVQVLVQVFYGATPKFSCASSPMAANYTCGMGKCCANCTSYEFHGRMTSAVSEWNLICDRRHLKAMTQAVYMAGLLVGSIVFSVISDHFGRKIGFFISIACTVVCATVSAVADCLSLFSLFRFGAGAGVAGLLLVRYVYCMEMVVTSNRTAAGFVSNIFVAVGMNLLALLAYLIRDWRHLMLVASLPNVLFLPFWWWFPESPRWLVAQNRLDEARQVLEMYARKSGKGVDSKHLAHVIQEVRKADARKVEGTKPGVLDLLRTSKLRKRTIICCYNWFVNSMVFYGLNLNAKNIGGNIYFSFFALSVVDLPAGVVCYFLFKRFGRRIPYSSFMITGGVAGILILAVPTDDKYQSAVVALAMIGKFCVISTFLGIYLFTCELYPTVIRNTGIGVSSMVSRIAGILAPYVVLLADLPNLQTLPMVIFGVLALVAGIMALWLPETLFSPMPQTVEQAEAWEEDYHVYCCKKTRAPDDTEAQMEVPMDERNELKTDNEMA